MKENFKALLLSHKTAPVAVREQVSLDEDGIRRFLRFCKDYVATGDVLLVSTCNRTEIYYTSENDLSRELLEGLRIVKGLAESLEVHFAKCSAYDAINHLFEVGTGLDSQVIGDLQIAGQIKQAYQLSADEGVAGPFLHRLMHTIFFVNKRVSQETSFRDGAASISYAAKELTEELSFAFAQPRVLILGMGQIGQDVARNLKDSRLKDVTILNRTESKAKALAEECGFAFGGHHRLQECLQVADVIISCVSKPEPIIDEDLVGGVKFLSHKYFIDLSMPRSIAPQISNMPGIVLFNLDDITEKTSTTLEKRKASIPQVKSIIGEAVSEFDEWAKEMTVSPTIQKIKNTLEQIRQEELARYLKNATPNEASRLEEMSKSLMQKILKYPVLQLKAACKRGEAESLSEVLTELFDLERATQKK